MPLIRPSHADDVAASLPAANWREQARTTYHANLSIRNFARRVIAANQLSRRSADFALPILFTVRQNAHATTETRHR